MPAAASMQRLVAAAAPCSCFGASCTFSSATSSSSSSSSTAATLPHSDLSYRALLRNLRLLKGMRETDARRAVVTGYDAEDIAKRMAVLEPGMEFDVAGYSETSMDLDHIKALKGHKIDSVIVSQAYHGLGSREALAALHACLHPDEGTLGFLWTRATGSDVSQEKEREGEKERA
jgi:hypothetical protein